MRRVVRQGSMKMPKARVRRVQQGAIALAPARR